ncbi:hypothetical protein F5Y16DRAFT_395496 [Xylariaceae sp. FL0255]|nr:hypothetical protein F5Y16DRAFT_395496 [Xylariaceae sp. FL0255]
MHSHLLPFSTFMALALGHGYIATPQMRVPGAASTSACGDLVTQAIIADRTSHVEGLPELAAEPGSGYTNSTACNLWLCRGLQFADNTANVQVWEAGEVVPVTVNITIPHLGYANVSIVDTRTNEIITPAGEAGEGGDEESGFLVNWPSGYADEVEYYAGTLPKNQTAFNVTIPTTLGDRCATAGDCVLQWWWYGTGAKQTYESCVDFTVAAS